MPDAPRKTRVGAVSDGDLDVETERDLTLYRLGHWYVRVYHRGRYVTEQPPKRHVSGGGERRKGG